MKRRWRSIPDSPTRGSDWLWLSSVSDGKKKPGVEMAAALKTDPTHPIARAFVDDRLVADL